MNTLLLPDSPVSPRIHALLHATGRELAAWLHVYLLRHSGKNWWKKHVCEVVSEQDKRRILDGEWKELEDLDLSALLRVLVSNFRFLKGRRALDEDQREVIRRMREARNRCQGHWPGKGLPRDEVVLHLRAIGAFASFFGKSPELLERQRAVLQEVESLAIQKEDVAVSPPPSVRPTARATDVRLEEAFHGTQLTASQKAAVESLQAFLDDPEEQCFVLRGYAGTGKTFLIGGLMRHLRQAHRMPVVMAPTGRAAHVLKERHQAEAATIHRHIYSMTDLKEFREIDESGDVTFKFYFALKNNDIEHDTVFIVDEASMVSDNHSEAEFLHFGSGRLLSDLLRYINFDANDYRKKLIFVGDDAQLPPVGMKTSPALDEQYLKTRCLLRTTGCALTDVVRQDQLSLVLENATRMRDLLRSRRFPSFDLQSDGDSVCEVPPDHLVSVFDDEFQRNQHKAVIIVYTNASAKTYNEAVRERLFPGVATIAAGDRIVVVKNNYNYAHTLLNGQMGEVIQAANETERKTVPLSLGVGEEGKRKTELVELEFRDAVLRFQDEKGDNFDVTCKIFEKCLMNGEAGVPSAEVKALYVDFRIRHPHLKPGQKEFKETLKSDLYFNAVMLKFGYAITCHKAQGGEWKTVFVDFAGKNKLNEDGLRWSYTALTRAQERIVASNALHHGLLKPVKSPVRPRRPAISATQSPDQSQTEAHLGKDPVQWMDAPERPVNRSERICAMVEASIPEEWKIGKAESLQFHERLTIVAGAQTLSVSVYYKGNDRISRVQIKPTPGQEVLEADAQRYLSGLKGRLLVEPDTDAGELLPQHRDFFEELKKHLKDSSLKIIQLRSNTEFHAVACYSLHEQEGWVNYHFDGKGTLSTYRPEAGCPPEIQSQINSIHTPDG